MAALALGAGALLAGAVLLAHVLSPKAVTIYLDNGGDLDVVVAADDGQRIAVPHWDFRSLSVSPGPHRLTARAPSGHTVDEQLIVGGKRDTWTGQSYVWNIGGFSHYAVFTMVYGVDFDPGPPVAVGEGERVFAIPDGVGTDFLGAMPRSKKVRPSTRSATEKRVYHRPLHEDRPCCAAIMKMVQEDEAKQNKN
jgi:hypothetical protein